MNQNCNICGRKLNIDDDPLSNDCGGDCWGCIGEMEADMGSEPSLNMVRQEYKDGYRPHWIPSPEIRFSSKNAIKQGAAVTIEIFIARPLGEPWSNVEFEVAYLIRNSSDNISFVASKLMVKTNEGGVVSLAYSYPELKIDEEPWVEISRELHKWSFPIRER